MAKYRSALGKVVDMATLAAKNEKTRAVGNMKVNARGDVIDSTGKVIKSATSKVNEVYSKTVGNRSAQPVRRQEKPRPSSSPPPSSGVNAKIEEVELTAIEKDLEDSMEDDIEVEAIKAKETGKK